jgi:hypothetical protein
MPFAPRWRGPELARLLDQRHSEVVAAVVEALRRHGWEARPELTFSRWGERGSIDVFAWDPDLRVVLVVECKSVVVDLQDLLSTMDRKRRLAADIAQDELGWSRERLAPCWSCPIDPLRGLASPGIRLSSIPPFPRGRWRSERGSRSRSRRCRASGFSVVAMAAKTPARTAARFGSSDAPAANSGRFGAYGPPTGPRELNLRNNGAEPAVRRPAGRFDGCARPESRGAYIGPPVETPGMTANPSRR